MLYLNCAPKLYPEEEDSRESTYIFFYRKNQIRKNVDYFLDYRIDHFLQKKCYLHSYHLDDSSCYEMKYFLQLQLKHHIYDFPGIPCNIFDVPFW